MRENQRPTRDRTSTSTDTNRHNSTNNETSEKPVTTTKTCGECGGDIITDESTGERICDNCSLIIDDDVIDHGPEWRAYNQSERSDKARTGAPLTELRHDKGLSTNIDWRDQDAQGRQLSSKKRKQMQRLRKWDHRAKHDSKSKNIAYANGEIKRMGSALGAPKGIRETGGSLYRQVQENDLVPGRSIEAMATASLYISLRIHGTPRSLDELTTVSRVSRKELQRAYRYICRELDIPLKPTDPTQYIPRFATKIENTTETELPQHIIKQAERLATNLTDTHHTSGNDPTVLAASALYAAALREGTLLTQSVVKNAADVTEVSIRNNYTMFLTLDSETPLTESDVTTAETPLELAAQITDNPVYLRDIPNTLTHTVTEHTTNDQPDSQRNTGTETQTERDPDTEQEVNTEPMNYACDTCPCVFTSFTGLKIHNGHKHNTELTDKTQYEVPAETNPALTAADLRKQNPDTNCTTDTNTDTDSENDSSTDTAFTVPVHTLPTPVTDERTELIQTTTELLNAYNHTFHSRVKDIVTALIERTDLHSDTSKSKKHETAVAAALYAVVGTKTGITETTYTQPQIEHITGIPTSQISKNYQEYADTLNTLLESQPNRP